MAAASPIEGLFVDVGGVLLTNGWDRRMRRDAAKTFSLDYAEMDDRHHLTFGTYEEGKITLDEYLNRVVFYEERSFSREDFRDFMFRQSQPYPDMIHLVQDLKRRWNLKIAVVSNEGRELTEHRIQKFDLSGFIDVFVCSCFVHTRKPDTEIYRIALDMVQIPPGRILYLEDRPMFIEIARGMGIRGIVHADYETTRAALEAEELST
jgi:putative hydrolase of the HAD superfamily